jgi:branched-chain amino acid aminotransferase
MDTIAAFHYDGTAWVRPHELTLSPFDLSVLRGFGVFDFLRTYHNIPYKLPQHIKRLENSARQLGITLPYSLKRIEELVLEGIKKNSFPETNIRIVATGGVTLDGITPGKPSFFILCTPAHDYPDDFYTSGVSVATKEFLRAIPAAKSLNYLSAVVELAEAKKQGAVEVVYRDGTGKISEGTTSNIFFVIGGKLVTPNIEGILVGITRGVVISIAQKLDIPVVETDVYYSQIPLFDEVFLTASNKEVMPVVKMDGKVVRNGNVGPVSHRIITEFRRITQG